MYYTIHMRSHEPLARLVVSDIGCLSHFWRGLSLFVGLCTYKERGCSINGEPKTQARRTNLCKERRGMKRNRRGQEKEQKRKGTRKSRKGLAWSGATFENK